MKGKKRKSFLDNQLKNKRELKRRIKDPDTAVDETRVRFQTFSEQVASVEASIVYQLGGIGTIEVYMKVYIIISKSSLMFIRLIVNQVKAYFLLH